MEILFSHIPSGISPEDLYAFVRNGLKTFGLPIAIPVIEKCEILKVHDEEAREIEFHGLVKFQDPAAAEHAIQKLRGKLLNGQYVRVREFFHRTPGDRRGLDGELQNPVPNRRQPLDRRRPQLVVSGSSFQPSAAA